jgi:hypothetical protein
LELPVRVAEYSGTGRLRIDFYGLDWGEAHYVEDYEICTIVADSRT